MSARYAVFFCPDDSTELALFGARVLHRYADGAQVASSADDYPDRQLASELSQTPAHYGFHATLKAPFQLADGFSEVQLLKAVQELAMQQLPISMLTLRPRLLSDFVALGFDAQPQAIAALAECCVIELEPFRAPLTSTDIAKRKPEQLTPSQRAYLSAYGYPYVLAEFRFHMTLTGAVEHASHQSYIDWLSSQYEKLVPNPPMLDRLAVFWQPDRQTPFKRIAQFAFGS